MSLKIIHPGTYSILVDGGRTKTRSLGVPAGGAFDRAAYRLANALVGNTENAVALELTHSGPCLIAEHAITCTVFGADFSIRVDENQLRPATIFRLSPGNRVTIGVSGRGARGYLCTPGGFSAPRILGSGSAFNPLVAGDRLLASGIACWPVSLGSVDASSQLGEGSQAPAIRVVSGPQADWFSSDRFYQSAWTVSPQSNRMGIRLEGTPLLRPQRELVSEPVAPGAIQITNEGLPIILGVDGQTIGGYPKIAHVITADFDKLAQFRPGETICFEKVSLEAANQIHSLRQQALRRRLTSIRIFSTL